MSMDSKARKYFGIGFMLIAIAIILLLVFGIRAWPSKLIELTVISFGLLFGLFVAYVMYHNFSEQKILTLPLGEDILLRPRGYVKTYFAFQINSGEKVNLPPVPATLYLTNLGIIGEIPNTGECSLYIPHYNIRNFSVIEKISGKSVRVNFIDVHSMESEVILYLGEDSDLWFQKLSEILGV